MRSNPHQPVHTLFILNSLSVGGAEMQVVSLINRMDETQFKVSLVCIKEGHALLEKIERAPCFHGLHCLNVSSGLEWPAVRKLAQLIDEHHIDVLVCTNMYALLYGWLARRLCRHKDHVRLVEVFHTTAVGSRKEHLSMLLYKQLLRGIDLLVYVCKGQAGHWHRRGLRSLQEQVIYNGVDTLHFSDVWSDNDKIALRHQYGLQASDYVVGLCAVMRPEKAHGDLLLALKLLKNEGINIKCMLIGDGPERARIDAQIVALDLADNVRITGMVQDVRPLIAACDVMVLASHAVETFSIAALESMSLGKPMVMTDIGGAPEQVTQGDNGLLFPAGDVGALAQCLRRLTDATQRHDMGSRAALRVRQDFDVNHMVLHYEHALAALASTARAT
ncbi:MAG: glycosyltransferase [Burkholderiaceae bacterium]|nr:glycosyltransferase [Burkholderiaceae bacterium]